MQQEEDNRKSECEAYNLTPEKLQRTSQDGGSGRRNPMSHHSLELKSRTHFTPYNSPDKYSKTPQSGGSFRKEVTKSKLDSTKRKIQSCHNENLEKIQKTGQSGKFVNALIGQWSKHMGMQTPLSQSIKVQESPMVEEIKRKYAIEERKIQKLQKKLQAAEETISSLSASHETELRAKEEILQQLNSDWESITKYYYEISESLKEFQQHKDNLSKLYDNVIVVQQSTVKKLQQELSIMRLKDEEHKNVVSAVENKAAQHEKRIQEMVIAETELRKQLDEVKKKSILEKDQLHNIHAEEKLELMKKQDKLTSINKDLQVKLETVAEEKQNLTNLFVEKDKKICKLQEEIVACKNKVQDLVHQNTELSLKYEESVHKEEELKTQMESKVQEFDKLRENLEARQNIETSLAQDLDIIDNKYRNVIDDLSNIKNQLNETQIRNLDLERSLEDMKHNNQQKIMKLNKTIKDLEEEKEKILSEKHSKVQELENVCELLKQKHEKEIISLRNEFNIKLADMKKSIDTQNTAFTKLNETLNKMNEASQIIEKYNAKENSDKLQKKSKWKPQPIVEVSQMKLTQNSEMKEQEFQENILSQKLSKNKNEISTQKEQDIYDFNITNVNDKLQNVFDSTENYSYLSQSKNATQLHIISQENNDKTKKDQINSPQKKKIFKTRSTGLKQYGTPRRIFKK
ncbi:uncharacterized protein LOC117610959 isoform X1 [Osmia lignaria lignaria]|uniref:uncharacterized protein LOC117610959 isoform X1 n=1 Tax=Osmia lignaria lignaria TaxID=1437193 RepID=UPI00402BDF45